MATADARHEGVGWVVAETFRFAWWNTSFNRTRDATAPAERRAHERRRARAEGVINGLLNTSDCVALGEVATAEHQQLRSTFAGLGRAWYRDDARNLSVILDDAKATVTEELSVSSIIGARTLHAAFRLSLNFVARSGSVDLYVIHWPSGMDPSAAAHRRTLAQDLKRDLERAGPPSVTGTGHPVLMGDFNEEPYDIGITEGLLAGRDRARVRTAQPSTAYLYNPAWRLLGERVPWPQEQDADQAAAGSYYTSASGASRWRTVDQVIVGAGLLGRDGWTLDEGKVRFGEDPNIFDASSGTLVRRFDHLPLVSELVFLERPSP